MIVICLLAPHRDIFSSSLRKSFVREFGNQSFGKNNVSPSQVGFPKLESLITKLKRAYAAESLIDKAIELNSIGGVYGNQRPTHFLCLLLKLLQIQPEKEILIEYLMADEFK